MVPEVSQKPDSALISAFDGQEIFGRSVFQIHLTVFRTGVQHSEMGVSRREAGLGRFPGPVFHLVKCDLRMRLLRQIKIPIDQRYICRVKACFRQLLHALHALTDIADLTPSGPVMQLFLLRHFPHRFLAVHSLPERSVPAHAAALLFFRNLLTLKKFFEESHTIPLVNTLFCKILKSAVSVFQFSD